MDSRLLLAGIAVVAIAIIFASQADLGKPRILIEPAPPGNGPPASQELAEYFSGRMQSIGEERVGFPDEGFNANMYLLAFPGLQEADFHGVRAYQGFYSFTGGKLTFTLDTVEPLHSASNTITEEGMATLLENLEERLGIEAASQQAVDSIIEAISLLLSDYYYSDSYRQLTV